jgi:hypothetical protein
MSEGQWNCPELAAYVATLLRDESAWRSCVERSAALARPEAAAEIVGDFESLLGGVA